MPAERARDSYAAFRIANYGRFIVSLLTMTLGAQVQAIVVSWQIYQVTRDHLALGLVGLAEVIPCISVALAACSDRQALRQPASGSGRRQA